MSNRNVVILSVLVLALAAPSLGVIYFNDFAATKQTWLGRGLYTSNSNYSTLKFGRVAKTEFEMSVMDFDRAGMLNWVQGIYNTYNGGTITNVNQIINDAVKMTLYLTAYDSWEDSGVQPPTIFGHYFWPGVRLSKGQDWVESLATFNNAAGAGFPWHDSAGNALANIYVNKYNTTANMILNATSEQWGAADTIGGGADVYAYDTPRPWLLDDTVAYAALKNPDVVDFNMVHDMYNKPWTSANGGEDDCTGTIYGRLHGLTEYRPFLEVVVDPGKIHPIPPHWYMPADFNKDYKVSFADYLILEANFGESGMTNAQGDCAPVYWVDNYPYLVGDGKVSFADYLELEREFGGTWQPIPEPATIGLLALGGLAILRRR